MSLKKIWFYFGFDKLQTLKEMYQFNGGLKNMIYQKWKTDACKLGTLVGEDKYGNKYYKNDRYILGSNRWVEYNDKVYFEFDGSQIPAEWHNWLHYTTDHTPIDKPRVEYKWIVKHEENQTDTLSHYVPYSTVPNKIKCWQPKGTQIKVNAAK